MSTLIQVKGLFIREIARFFKVPLQTIGAPIVNAALYLMIFGVSLGNSIRSPDEIPYLAFLIPGLIAMSVIKNAFDNSTMAIMGPKYVNELQDLRTVPLSRQQIVWAKTFASLVRGLLVGLITYLVGQTFFFFSDGQVLTIAHPFILAYFLLIGGLSFGFLGVAIGMLSRSFEHVGAVSALILLPLIYLGGVFFTLKNLHPFWQTVSLFNPLFYMINGVREGILGSTDINFLPSAIVAFALFLVTYFCADLSLRKGTRYLR
ncbi:ABC transporter permease [Simkania sp.]|uniref:ABC transporter permease n=1 Tax=Simkania sp. TaxID=34094 RepID=UPI003B5178C4